MNTKLDRLEAIQTMINRGVIRRNNYIDTSRSLMNQGQREDAVRIWNKIPDLRRGLDRLRIAFDKELDLLKYNRG